MFSLFRRLWTARPNRRTRRATARKTSPKLGADFAPLEDRITPIIGAYDLATEVPVGGGYDAVGQYGVGPENNWETSLGGTGTLLPTFRHVLAAAHLFREEDKFGNVIGYDLPEPITFRLPGPNGEAIDPIRAASSRLDILPDRLANPSSRNDLAVTTLTELAPLTLQPFDIYTESNELDQFVTHVGYGRTGTGTLDLRRPWNAQTQIQSTSDSEESQRIWVIGKPTGGSFSLWLPNSPEDKKTFNWPVSADQIANELQELPGLNTVIPDVPELGDVYPVRVAQVADAANHPFKGSFEVAFGVVDTTLYPDYDVPQLAVQSNLIGGMVVIETINEGGTPSIKRVGGNEASKVEPLRFGIDFDNGSPAADVHKDGPGWEAGEVAVASGDSGGPAIIGDKIAGITALQTGGGLDGSTLTWDFGSEVWFTRVSAYQDFINNVLDEPYDLVLNMNNQPWGNDDSDIDDIRVTAAGGLIRIYIENVLRYQDNLNLIKSVRVEGSNDHERISIESLGKPIPITVNAGGGKDTVWILGLATGAKLTVSGGTDHDIIAVGAGSQNLKDNIRGTLSLAGGGASGDDRIEFRDQNATDINPLYTLEMSDFSRTGINPIGYAGFNEVGVYTGQKYSLVKMTGSSAAEVDIIGGPLGDTFELGDPDGHIAGGSHVHVDGAGGMDVLRLAFSGQQYDRYHRFQNGSYQHMTTAGGLTYDTVSHSDVYLVQLLAGTGKDTIDIQGNAPGTVLSVNGGGNSDTFQGSQGDLDALGGWVEVHGGTGFNIATLDDTAETTSRTFELTTNKVKRPGVDILVVDVAFLSLNTSDKGHTFRIHGTPAYTMINADGGTNWYHLSPTDQDLGKLSRGLRLSGGSEFDQVMAYDRNQAGGASYALTGFGLDRSGFGGLDFFGMEWVVMQLGEGGDTVNLNGTAAGTKMWIAGNGGWDELVVNTQLTSDVYFDGGAGFDQVTWLWHLPPSDPNSGYDNLHRIAVEWVYVA